MDGNTGVSDKLISADEFKDYIKEMLQTFSIGERKKKIQSMINNTKYCLDSMRSFNCAKNNLNYTIDIKEAADKNITFYNNVFDDIKNTLRKEGLSDGALSWLFDNTYFERNNFSSVEVIHYFGSYWKFYREYIVDFKKRFFASYDLSVEAEEMHEDAMQKYLEEYKKNKETFQHYPPPSKIYNIGCVTSN